MHESQRPPDAPAPPAGAGPGNGDAGEVQTLRERISTLCGASVRISASLDLPTLLGEVVDSARALTGARYGAVTTVDADGQLQDFVTRGTTESEHRRLLEWPDGPRLFERLRDLPGPIRLADLPSHLRALGLDGDGLLPYRTFQGTPMRHLGEHDVERVLDDVAPKIEEIKSLFGLDEVGVMKAVIVNSRREARQSFPFISEAATSGHLYGGFAFGEMGVFILHGLYPNGIIHEMAHLLLHEAVDSPLARVPSWLNEGLAMYFEEDSANRHPELASAQRRGDLLPLRSMFSQPGRPRDVHLFYAKSRSVVGYMMNEHGADAMTDLLARLDGGKSIEEAVRASYGMSLDELDRRWEAYLTGEAAPQRAIDPLSSATTFMIAGAVAVTTAVLAFRWLRGIVTQADR